MTDDVDLKWMFGEIEWGDDQLPTTFNFKKNLASNITHTKSVALNHTYTHSGDFKLHFSLENLVSKTKFNKKVRINKSKLTRFNLNHI